MPQQEKLSASLMPDFIRQRKGSAGSRKLFSGLIVCLLTSAVLLTGCQSRAENPHSDELISTSETAGETSPAVSDAKEISADSEQDTEETTSAIAEETTALSEEVPPEEGMVRSPLTNEWVSAEQAAKRPIAVMYPTDKKAQPQYGLDRISVFYEIMEEGSMSRQMGLLEDWEDLERIGNIRSTRDYFIIESMEWDSILVHFGGPEVFVKDLLTRDDVDNINGTGGRLGDDYGAFFRIPAGSRSEHTAYTDGERLKKAIEKAGFETEHRKEYWDPVRWKFAPESVPVDLGLLYGDANSYTANEIDMSGCYPITKSTFHYNAEDGLYYRSIYGSPQKDAVSGMQLAFDNILIESCTSGSRGAGYLYFHVLDEGHQGWFITRGRMIHCTWKKTREYETTRFYDDFGNEITLNTGKTMICIGRTGDSFTADGNQFKL